MLFNRIHITFFVLFITYFSFAQKEDIQFEHLSMKDGLSMNPIMAIEQDRKGFLWFGSQDGLNKFDGYKFEVFKNKDDDSTSISDNFITALSSDNQGKLWVGTLSGLNVYNSITNSFKRFNYTCTNFSCTKIYCLFKDNKGLLWIGTERGLAIFDAQKEEFLQVNSKFRGLSDLVQKSVLCITQDKKGNYWIGTTNGLIKYNSSDYTIKNYNAEMHNGLSNNIILSFHEDSSGNMWIGTLEGLNKFNAKDETFSYQYFKEHSKFLVSTNKSSALEGINIYSIVNNYGGNTIRCIKETTDGMFWIGTDMELVIYNPINGKYINYKKDLINPNGINDHFIRSMFIDQSQNLWIGTLGNGLNKVNLKPKKFKHYQKKINNQFSLSENYVRSICEDESGNIWIGVLVGGLNKFVVKSDSFYHYTKTAEMSPKSINDNNVWSLCYDKYTKGLWIGTNNGLDYLDIKTSVFKHYVHQENDPNSIGDNTIRNVFIDSKGNLWLGTENGLSKFNRKNQSFKNYTTQNSGLSNSTVWKVVEDKNGNIWLGTNDGLNVFNPVSESFSVYKKIKNDENSLSHNCVRSLLVDSDNQLWIGTQNGLNQFDFTSKKFKRYFEKDGLPNAFIYAIEEDKSHQLWMSSNKGISLLNKRIKTFKNYDVFDGLQDFEFNTNACYYASTGEMYFGGPNGMNVFNPTNLNTNNYIAPVVFTTIKILDKEYDLSEASEVKEIELNYKQNILYFEFSSLDYTNPSRNRYMYKMEGFNDDWVDAGNVRFINYTNLNPGVYTFKVKGANSDGVWNPEEISIKITITPPFWKTTWFYILCAIMTVVSVFLFISYRTQKLRKSKLLLEAKVKQRTQQVESQKNELEQKNKDITDSINYAKRIQNALLPDEQQFIDEFAGAFVLFRPRDIVSGDLFWLVKVKTSNDNPPVFLKVVAAADCTGHGVPGAFMGMLTTELLNNSIKNPEINSPSDLLGYMNKKLPEGLNRNSKEKINDGLDIAVCAIDTKAMKVYYGGANRPLWIVRKNSEVKDIEEYKATKASIGGYTSSDQVFENNIIVVEKGDRLFMFSDGITDQFGGDKGKKFGKARLKTTILQSAHYSIAEQKKHIEQTLMDWQGSREQVDDILMIGIEI